MTTQQETNKARVRDYIGNVVNKHVRDRFPEYISEASIDHSAPAGFPGGPEGTRLFFSMFYEASSDMSNDICEMLAEDDAVAFVSVVSGTHTGVLMGQPPTHKKFRILLIETVRLHDGKYIEHWGGMDIAAMMGQLAAPPEVDVVAGMPPLHPAAPIDNTAGSRQHVEANKALIRSLVETVFTRRDLDALGNYFADPLRGINQMAVPESLEQVKGYFRAYLDAFPDLEASIDGLMGENDLIALRLDLKGTHQGTFMGAPATGKSFAVSSMHVFRITDGRITERWEWVDLTALFRQLGVQPGAPAQDDAKARAEQYAALVETYIAGVNEHDPSKLRAAFAADFTDHMNTPVAGDLPPGGAEAVVAAHEQLHASFPDIKFYVDELTIDGDKVAIRVHAEGTHTGQFYMFPPTNKQITWTAHRILRVANGQFVESWNEFDQVSILQQMGIIPPLTPAPDPAANKAAVLRFYEEVSRLNFNIVDEVMSYNVVAHGDSLAETINGRDSVKAALQALRAAFPDLVVKVTDVIAAEDRVITRLRWTGTHMQAFAGMPPTNKQMSWTGIATHRFVSGQIAERWLNTDGFALLRQLGIIPF